MSSEVAAKRCKSCGKLLLDEKIPFCRRCLLEGRNKAVNVGEIIGGVGLFVTGVISTINNNNTDSDDEEEI